MAKKLNKGPARKVKKADLGLGVSALFNKSEEEIQENKAEIIKELANTVAMIPIGQIAPNPNQPRLDFDDTALEELAASIKVHGLIQPVTVRRLGPEEFQLISGERRWRASKMAKLEEIPTYVRLANDQEMLEMALIENIQRENLNAIEVATTFARLKEECALTDEELSIRVGKKRETITNQMRLLKLPEQMRIAIKEGQISKGHGVTLAGVNDFVLQNSLFQETLNKGLSVRALEALKRELETPKPRKTKPTNELSTEYRNVEQNLREFFGTRKVQLKLKGQDKGQIVIPFNSVDELNDLIDRIEDQA